MSSLSDDLDRFLKTDGLRIIFASNSVRTAPCKPLTVNDIGGLRGMDLDELDADRLWDLMDSAEDLRDSLEDGEPGGEDSGEYDLWEDRLSEVEDFIGRIQDRLDELEDEEENPGAVTKRIT